MTVIAFDGTTLAADRQLGDYPGRAITKIRRTPAGELIAITGAAAHGWMLMGWYSAGAPINQYPQPPTPTDWATLYVFQKTATGHTILKYENYAWPFPITCDVLTAGTGADLARGALAMGATARQAVEIACQFDHCCGMGVDTLEL